LKKKQNENTIKVQLAKGSGNFSLPFKWNWKV